MSSTTKALELLSCFSEARPELGLSEIRRIAGRDKATTYRHLQDLEAVGFVEQNQVTKNYRLGPALLHLAQVREASVPRKAGAEGPLAALAKATGETAHVAVLSDKTLYPLLARDSPTYAIRAIIDLATFPLHATSSGICAVAFGPEALFEQACAALEKYTEATPVTRAALTEEVARARATGFGHGLGTFEADITSFAAPIFDQTGQFAATVAVAGVASRLTPHLEALIKFELAGASRAITRSWGGSLPAAIEDLWSDLTPPSEIQDPTS
ncbi:IclR family transcriptional regulator [Sulfitobacter sp. PS-8MA]|uniref:IclR family transcriptional regulator n=1 Tax=Sulfitobacter sp. PS-8MA TaxID=3237707 RepID=UPI0034C68560